MSRQSPAKPAPPRKKSESKLVRIAREQYNESLDTLLPRLVSEKGSVLAAAAALGVAPFAVVYQMKKMGYRPKPVKSEWVQESA